MTANVQKCDGARKTNCTSRHGTGECEPNRRKTGPGVSAHDKYSPNGRPSAHAIPKRSLSTKTRSQPARERSYRYAEAMEDEARTPLDRVLGGLKNVQRCGDGHSARCPAHADGNNSLTVNEDETGKVLLYCHRGCSFDSIVKALGLEVTDLFPPISETQNATREVVCDHRPASNAANIGADTATQPTQRVPCEPKPVAAEGSSEDWAALVRRHREEAGDGVIEMLAGELGVSAEALRRLEIGWNEKDDCYTFPERNGRGEIVGVSCRFEDGSKRAIKGSKRGLTLPAGWNDGSGPVLIPEGASDTAAALTLGLAVVGRPSANGGLKDLVELLSGFPADREIIVVGEIDAKTDGSWPGRDAAIQMAEKLAEALQRPVKWCLPPDNAKDLREWLKQQDASAHPADLGSTCLQGIVRQNGGAAAESRIEFIDTQTLEATEFRLEWLIKDLLVAGQPCIVGGPKKSLKTSVLIDLAVSLGSGYRFLNNFEVPQALRVGLISGESGEATVKETYLRIRNAKFDFVPGGEHPAVDVHWAFRLPKLGTAGGLEALRQTITEKELKVVILDPLYLSLLSGRSDVQASNMFHMGPLLADVTGVCLDAGATPIMAHHTTKPKGFNYEVPELEDLAFAGVQEFARQWMLLGRREKYEPGTGQHKLWLNVGGSAGFSGCWGLDISEGVVDQAFRGRTWNVQVTSMSAQLQADKSEKQQAKLRKEREDRNQDMDKIRRVLSQYPEGETLNQIAALAHLGKSKVQRLIAEMVSSGEIAPVELAKSAGRSTRTQDGYKLADGAPQVEDAEETGADVDGEDELAY